MWKHDSKPCNIHKNKAINLFDFPKEIEATFHKKKKQQNNPRKSYILEKLDLDHLPREIAIFKIEKFKL